MPIPRPILFPEFEYQHERKDEKTTARSPHLKPKLHITRLTTAATLYYCDCISIKYDLLIMI
jgi:hypothetical protein